MNFFFFIILINKFSVLFDTTLRLRSFGNYFISRNYNVYVEKLANEAAGNSGGLLKKEQEYLGVAQEHKIRHIIFQIEDKSCMRSTFLT